MSDFITVEDLELFAETLGKELGVKWFRALRRIGFRISGSAQLGNVAGTVSNTSTQRPRGVNVRVETTQGAGEQVLPLWECCPVPFEGIESYVGKRFTIGYPPDRPDELHVLWPSSIDKAAFGQRTAYEQLMLATVPRSMCEGRLTLTTATPVTTSGVTGATTLYFTPYTGDRISLYSTTTSTWRPYLFTERSISLAGKTADTNYDVFIYNSSGTITLELVAWTDDTTRATALTRQNGVLVKSGDATRKFLGTIRINGSGGQCDDHDNHRFVSNYYNAVQRTLECNDTTDSWTYTTETWRAANANTTDGVGRVRFVSCVNDRFVWAVNYVDAFSDGASTRDMACGIGLDRTNGNDASIMGGKSRENAHNAISAYFWGETPLGAHYLQRVEISEAADTTTWQGDANRAWFMNGMFAYIWG